jgi:Putative Flp pilus-assembly TadE/G-like
VLAPPARSRGRTGRRLRGDQGAVAITVAILLAGGVLLGMMALVVDLGQIYAEREELQTGADAAAIAVANACALATPGCSDPTAIAALAQHFADVNAADGRAHIAEVCGLLPGLLDPCGDPVGNLTDCVGTPPSPPAPYVQIRLSTETEDGKFLLPPTFAQAIGVAGANVAACARATWSGSGGAAILAMTISSCEFTADTTVDGIPHYGDADNPAAVDERVVNFWDNSYDGPGCTDPNGPLGAPGPAALLDGGGNTCTRAIPGDAEVVGSYGHPAGNAVLSPSCGNRLRRARSAGPGSIVYIPVHDGVETQPNNKILFHEIGLAPFLVTGYQFGSPDNPSHRAASSVTGQDPCPDTAERCFSGVFTGELIPLTNVTGGTAVVHLIG